MKKVLLLGGNYFQTTAIKAAKELGYYTITADYLPDNPGHVFADEYHNISTLDREAILSLAKRKEIDGIVSYASDVSAPTAAYVAECLGLPTNPLESVCLLTDKQQFRKFLRDNGFNTPEGVIFSEKNAARDFITTVGRPVIIKPTDSSGSKGVHKVSDMTQFDSAWDSAWEYSRNKRIFVEEYLEKCGYEIDADSFLVNGEFAYFGVMDQHNDSSCNPYVPVGLSGPSVLTLEKTVIAKRELHRLMRLLNMKQGAFNIEYIFDKRGRLYILEVGPRNGGNLITDTIKVGAGIDLARCTLQAAVGDPCDALSDAPFSRCVSSYIIHADKDGVYKGMQIAEEVKDDILRMDVFISPGEPVRRYDNAGFGIGAAIVVFPNQQIMKERMDHMSDYIRVIVE